jgi:hypothetical protein
MPISKPQRSVVLFAALVAGVAPAEAWAFCGTYVGSAGSAIYNEVSEVVLARSGKRTTLSLRNDVVGDVNDFALVVPIPSVIPEDQIHTLDHDIFKALDDYSAPRLVEYRCADFEWDSDADTDADADSDTDSDADADSDTDVDVEAEYIVGEYDIVILSAEGGDSLESWLDSHGYAMPEDSGGMLQEYIDSGSYFLAARVRPEAGVVSGDALSPIQLTYPSDLVSLPIRIGTLSSSGVQDLIIYGLGPYSDGALGIANYPEIEVEDECLWDLDEHGTLGEFYVDQFNDAIDESGGAAWTTEYAWGGGKCDPCSGNPPDETDLVTLGHNLGTTDLFFTRLHMRYTPEQATQDLTLYPTRFTSQSQLRYIRHERFLEDRWPICDAGWVDDPGSCDDPGPQDTAGIEAEEEQGAGQVAQEKLGCSAAPAPRSWAWLALLVLGLTRRSTRRG